MMGEGHWSSCFDLAAGCESLRSGVSLFVKFLELLGLQGTSSNFLVLRIKAQETIRVVLLYWVQPALGKRA